MRSNTIPALMRDTSRLVALGAATPVFSKAQIQVYSPAGEGLLLFSVDIRFLLESECVADASCA